MNVWRAFDLERETLVIVYFVPTASGAGSSVPAVSGPVSAATGQLPMDSGSSTEETAEPVVAGGTQPASGGLTKRSIGSILPAANVQLSAKRKSSIRNSRISRCYISFF